MPKFWIVDSFASTRFTGNPAVVVVLHADSVADAYIWNQDDEMLAITREFNQAETAFVRLPSARSGGPIGLQFWTNEGPINLCGHATLAAAHVLFTECPVPTNHRQEQSDQERESLTFASRLAGPLVVERIDPLRTDAPSSASSTTSTSSYRMSFPSTPGETVNTADDCSETSLPLNAILVEGFGLSCDDVVAARLARDLMIVLKSEEKVRAAKPNYAVLAKTFDKYILLTATADKKPADRRETVEGAVRPYDIVSRFFCPNDAVPEDPVTGSANCIAGPYWWERLTPRQEDRSWSDSEASSVTPSQRQPLTVFQASPRGGFVGVEVRGDRVLISGDARVFASGELR